MAGLCEGGNEPPGSLKATIDIFIKARAETYLRIRAVSKKQPKTKQDKTHSYIRNCQEKYKAWCKELPGADAMVETMDRKKRHYVPQFIFCSHPFLMYQFVNKKTYSRRCGTIRHHRIRSMIAEALRKKGLTVHEEVHGISQEGSCRRIDMLAILPGSTSAYIIDPTVRSEAQEQQPAEVHAEKCRIYEPTVPFYSEKYHLTSIEVVGLMIGARGTIPRLCQFLQEVPAEQRLHS
ncbi:hypothetical protein ANN_25061 [Periplaneta americana]|uniref:Uncharacterized protein n=1 Tax=Periplaneta americana TaxID=6978 RepID=A0ABQ8S0D1_PERAM|nr:hypothetical protein ANN_25061 [Periplaneta americana]